MRVLAAAGFLVAFVSSVSAAQYYVALDIKDKECKIVEGKVDPQRFTQIDPKAYKNRDEAKAASQAKAECQKK